MNCSECVGRSTVACAILAVNVSRKLKMTKLSVVLPFEAAQAASWAVFILVRVPLLIWTRKLLRESKTMLVSGRSIWSIHGNNEFELDFVPPERIT